MQRLVGDARLSTMIGTQVNFENDVCRAVEIHLPPGGGDTSGFHQHVLDYGLCFVGEDLHINLFHLKDIGKGPGVTTKVDDAKPIADGSAVFKPITKGDLTSFALHSLTNANPSKWLRCYQVELKTTSRPKKSKL